MGNFWPLESSHVGFIVWPYGRPKRMSCRLGALGEECNPCMGSFAPKAWVATLVWVWDDIEAAGGSSGAETAAEVGKKLRFRRIDPSCHPSGTETPAQHPSRKILTPLLHPCILSCRRGVVVPYTDHAIRLPWNCNCLSAPSAPYFAQLHADMLVMLPALGGH